MNWIFLLSNICFLFYIRCCSNGMIFCFLCCVVSKDRFSFDFVFFCFIGVLFVIKGKGYVCMLLRCLCYLLFGR